MGKQVLDAFGQEWAWRATHAQYEYILNINIKPMERQLKQRILNPRFSEISLTESIEISPTNSIRRATTARPLRQMKKFCAAALVIGFIAYRLAFGAVSVNCLIDSSHQLTQYLNKLANQSDFFYNIISIVSQEAIEVEILLMVAISIMRMHNLTIHMFVAIFYGIRAFYLQIEKLPYPAGIVSYPPVFPCFSVPYGITRDFYYSGHTGLMLFSALLWRRLGYKKMEVATYPMVIAVVLALLITRVHYIIDIVGGIIFTLWIDKYVLPKVIWLDYLFTCIYNWIMQAYAYLRAVVSN